MYYKIYNFCARIGWDKWAHALVFCVVTGALMHFVEPFVAVWVSLVLGVAKEVLDVIKGGRADWRDLVADAVGILLGLI